MLMRQERRNRRWHENEKKAVEEGSRRLTRKGHAARANVRARIELRRRFVCVGETAKRAGQ